MNAPSPLTPVVPDPPAQLLAGRIDGILASLLLYIAARFRSLGSHTLPLWNRVSRARRRLARLLALLAAGRLPRTSAPRPGRPGGPRGPYISHRQAWLLHALRDDPMRHDAANLASQLDHLLRDPATQSLLAAAPPQALKSLGRTLRPLCRLLGIPAPAPLQPPPPPPRPARPPRPPHPKPPPLLPLYPQSRPRPMPFLRQAIPKNRPA
ncbi:MAG: hypothetical protein IT555_10490 [Acetobacteraceae bacterium]|nr:hypothetical protein [Acetobacteraceae bacterium]